MAAEKPKLPSVRRKEDKQSISFYKGSNVNRNLWCKIWAKIKKFPLTLTCHAIGGDGKQNKAWAGLCHTSSRQFSSTNTKCTLMGSDTRGNKSQWTMLPPRCCLFYSLYLLLYLFIFYFLTCIHVPFFTAVGISKCTSYKVRHNWMICSQNPET